VPQINYPNMALTGGVILLSPSLFYSPASLPAARRWSSGCRRNRRRLGRHGGCSPYLRGRRPLRPTMDAAGVEHEDVQSGRATTSDPQGLAPPQMSLEAPPRRRGAVADQAQPNARWGSSVRSPASSFGCSVLAETAGRRPKQHRRPAGGSAGVRRRKFHGKKKQARQ